MNSPNKKARPAEKEQRDIHQHYQQFKADQAAGQAAPLQTAEAAERAPVAVPLGDGQQRVELDAKAADAKKQDALKREQDQLDAARRIGVGSERHVRMELHASDDGEEALDASEWMDLEQLKAREAELRSAAAPDTDEGRERQQKQWFDLGVHEERLAWRNAYSAGEAQSRYERLSAEESRLESQEAASESRTPAQAESAARTDVPVASSDAKTGLAPKGLSSYDAAEQARPELARGPNGEMKSTFDAARDRYRSVFQLRPEDHVRRLREESLKAGTPELRERFELQARFEESTSALNSSGKLTHASAEQRAQLLADHQRSHQADLAKLDLRSGSEHKASAVARLEGHSREPRAVWAKATYEASDLRSSLPAWETDRYDSYRDVVAAKLAQRDGVPSEGYIMSEADAERFDRVFAKFTAEVLHQQQSPAAQGQSEQAGKAVTGGDVNGLAEKPGDVARVPREVELPGYQASRAEDGRSVDYRAKGEDEVSFRDIGERISVSVPKRTDPKVLRAALTVASGKFERLSLNGSNEFREAAAREAVQMGIGNRISNPELKEFVKREQERLREQAQQQGVQQPPQAVAADAKLSASQALHAEQGQQAERQQVESLASSQHEERGAEAGSDKSAEMGGTDDMPVKRMTSSKAKGQTVAGTEDMPVTRPHRNDSPAQQQLGTDDMPIKRVPFSSSSESISAQQESGGVRAK
jgi:hypothetical protein